MTLRARLALIWLGIWIVLTAVGWLLLSLFDEKTSAGAAFLLAMGAAALVTFALQFLVHLGNAIGFLFDVGVIAFRRLRGLKRRA